MAFCFPEKQDHPHYLSNDSGASIDYKLDKKSKAGRNKAKKANFYVKTPLNKDDVEEMKARAQQNKLFGAKYLVFSPLVPSKWEKNVLALLSLYIFGDGSVFTFQFLNDKIHNYVKNRAKLIKQN